MSAVNAKMNPEFKTSETYISGNSIEAFFADSAILITGATGFLGKALLEKLLRLCTRVSIIFILIRPKRGKTIEQRCTNLLENSVFDRIRTKDPGALNKIYPINGDVSQPDLGLSPKDRSMLEERVNIVFHNAATVKFVEPLRVAVNLNTKGTDRIIELCLNIKNLKSVVHVSTAYSNANRKDVDESIYVTKVKPSTVIDMCDNLDEDMLNTIQKKLLENHPNTYTFSKNLAEQIVLTKGINLPIAIVRPSIISAAVNEPFPGWIEPGSTMTAFIAEVGKGTLRTMPCNGSLKVDVVPVDYVVDTIICASWYNAMQENDCVKIYNCTSNAKALTWGTARELIEKHSIESPSTYTIWYPGCLFISNKFLYNFMSGTLHKIPAFIGDFILRLLGSKPVMMRYITYITRAMETADYFTLHEWNFHRDNMINLKKKIKSLKDCESFNVDMEHLDWDMYVRVCLTGIKKYIWKEDSKVSSNARCRLSIFYCIHRLIQILSTIILVTLIIRVGH